MSDTTTETLVRQVAVSSYDGKTVVNTERITVQVTWPNQKPDSKFNQYVMYGSWTLTEENHE